MGQSSKPQGLEKIWDLRLTAQGAYEGPYEQVGNVAHLISPRGRLG